MGKKRELIQAVEALGVPGLQKDWYESSKRFIDRASRVVDLTKLTTKEPNS